MDDEVIQKELLSWADEQPNNRGGIEQYVGADHLGLGDFSFYDSLQSFFCEFL